jgi:hypothetical protein
MIPCYFKRIITSLIIVAATACAAAAQTSFTAVVSPAVISKNEYANLRLTVTNGTDIRDITPPTLKDIDIVSGPSQETGMSNYNGNVSNYLSLNYTIKPKRTGKFVFTGATANIAGTIYKAASTSLLVRTANSNISTVPATALSSDPFATPQPSKEYGDNIIKKGENILGKIQKNMHVKLVTNKTSCFVGEPIIATYKLYTRIRSEGRVTKNPSFNGFSVIDLQQPDITDGGKEMLDGREYNVFIIRKAQLYPLQAGKIELETAVLDTRVEFIKENAEKNVDVFGGFRIDPSDLIVQNVELSSKPISITVKPLPEIGKPEGFNGAVGEFNFKATIEKNVFTTNEAGKLVLLIEGAGNLPLITVPDVVWPQQIEAFDAVIKEDLLQTDVPVSGQKKIEIPFTVSAPGRYELPAISFSYFDPALGIYKTITSDPIAFTVKKGTAQKTYDDNLLDQNNSAGIIKKFFNNRALIVVVLIFLFVLGGWCWFRLDREKEKLNKNTTLIEGLTETPGVSIKEENILVAPDDLWATETCLNSATGDRFYNTLNHELKQFLANRFDLALYQVSPRSVTAAMDEAGYSVDLSLELQQLLQQIELELYTPFSTEGTKNELYIRAKVLIQALRNT